ncbi:MAG: GntR family transcriptional regulator, transcriptional repressor for pyruvate dehydrogenase complex [Solirubrobacteraceae bacterium]|nr:GntR family transcriptional regulator, transcriptional repressor for pyruvate dehydrogenase complex [Solirubrobacteraceae bacterium]
MATTGDATAARRGAGLVGAIVHDLEAKIVDGRLKAGDRLPTERDLAREWGVSRTTVRQALYELELKSLVDRTRRRGTTVADLRARAVTSEALLSGLSPHARQLAEVLDFRAAIEPAMSARAAMYATSSEIAEMDALLEAMAASGSAQTDIELDHRFHTLIAQATHNPLFVQLVGDMANWLRDVRRSQLQISPERRARMLRGHALFVEAIRARDPDAAARVSAEHVEQVRRELWPLLQADDEPAQP